MTLWARNKENNNHLTQNSPFRLAPYPVPEDVVGGVVYSMDGAMPVVAEEEVPQAKEATTNRVRKNSFPLVNILPLNRYYSVHQSIMHLFPSQIPNVPLAGRLKFFYKNWEKLTKDPQILSMMKGHKVINLKNLNRHIPYLHFKMEGLFLLKDMLVQNDFMIKLDLKDAYFSVPLDTQSQKFVSFQWKKKIYQFLCMCFGLGPAPRLFTKLMKVPISLLRKPNRRLIVYLDDILIMGKSIQEIITARDTIIFLLQNLGFSINEKKSVLVPSQVKEFLGMKIDSTKMLLILPKEKVVSITSYCQKLLDQAQVSVREIVRETKLIGTFSSTALAVLPAPLHYRGLQNQNIQTLPKEGSYNSLLTLSSQGRLEIEWWIKNLALNNGRTLLKSSPELIIPPMPLLKVRGRGPLVTQREDHGQFKKKNFI